MKKNHKSFRIALAIAGLTLVMSQNVYASEEESSTGDVVSVEGGISATLNDYYSGILNSETTEENIRIKIELDALTDEEIARKITVLDDYENIGIANVESYLNVRETPSSDGKIIGKMVTKAGCEILEDTGEGWYKISSGSVTGYVNADYILTGITAERAAIRAAELRAIVNVGSLNVRQEPNTEAEIATKLGSDERYGVIEDGGEWVLIEVDSGQGYVSKEFVTVKYALQEAVEFSPIDEKSVLRSQICDYGLQFLGNPYVWGGTNLTSGADCSGFTLRVFEQYGISLPRTSREQAKVGREISYSEARAGDLLFYSSTGGTIDHVAIYLGNGKIVHASSPSTGIIISNANNRTLVKCVNVID